MSVPPTPQEIWDASEIRYATDARFHARVKAAANLLKVTPLTVAGVLQAGDLGSEMLEVSNALRSALERPGQRPAG